MIQTLQRQIRNGSTTPNIGYDISFLQVQTLTAIIGTAIGLPKMAADIFVVELRQKLNTSTNKIKTVQTESETELISYPGHKHLIWIWIYTCYGCSWRLCCFHRCSLRTQTFLKFYGRHWHRKTFRATLMDIFERKTVRDDLTLRSVLSIA